jgi:uncharacterized protein YdeI (YjbR/CyaY-like superfamily)
MTAPPPDAKPKFFATPAAFRAWLERHHATAKVLWVGFHKRDTGTASITWPESVDEALCFGWIDGIRKKVSDDSYTNRFTPRRTGSNWSAINIAKIEELTKKKRMQPAGLAAFAKRSEAKSRIYSYEKVSVELATPLARKFKANKKAWAFFQIQPPYYRKIMTGWVNGAKQEETRLRRLDKLMKACESGTRFLA